MLARLDHSHCNSADPLTDGLEVCCVFYRPGPGGCYVCCVVVEGFGEQGEGGDAPQGSRRPRGGCHRGLGHMHCDSAGPWQASASRRLRKGCPGAMSSTRTTQIWRGASIGRAVRVGCASVRPPSVMLPCPPACTSLVSCLQKTPKKFSGNAPQMSLQKLSQNRPPCLSVGSRPRYH